MNSKLSFLFSALALVALAACGRIVGAECIDSHPLCGEVCCPAGMCSPDGVCLAPDQGPQGDGAVGDGGMGDDMGDGGIRLDGDIRIDMGPPGCDIGTSLCGTECVNLDFDTNNCGSCGNECDPGDFCSFGTCRGDCEPPFLLCGDECIDPNSDPDNCGACGNACVTDICRPTGCSEPAASDVILLGHEYDEMTDGTTKLVGNSGLLRLQDPVRIVVYDGTVENDNRMRVVNSIDAIATEASRSYVVIPSDASLVPTRLLRADTFLVMPQQGASTTDEELRGLGRMWRTALSSFLARGGAIVVLDGGGDHMGTWQILSEAGLLDVDGRVDVMEGATLRNIVPTDAITNEVPLSFAAPRGTVAFTGTSEGEVVTTMVGGVELPTAIHRFVAAPASP